MVNLNSNVQVEQVKNLLVIDPNGDGSNSVNTEDLSISVELEVYERGDEPIIFSDNNNNSVTTNEVPQEATRISFIDGSGDEEKYLTTHYTELNTKFSSNNKNVGVLGIESIDISFNTSYTPIVKIRFKDIRAKLFELGDESPYSFLFRMPYPIFYLTVKGYYGKPVQYALHLTKFNGELDNDTGSFIITCDFIGYTYAFLSDLLMGVLKGIPYTQEGMGIIDKQSDFITFSDLTLSVQKLEEKVTAYRNDNKKLKALTIFDDLNTKLENIENSLLGNLNNLINNSTILNDFNVNSGKFISLILGKDRITDKNFEYYKKNTLSLVEEFISFNKIVGSDNYIINLDDFELNSEGVYYNNFRPSDFFILDSAPITENSDGTFNSRINRTRSFQEFQENENNILNKYKNLKAVSDEGENIIKENLYNDLINIIEAKFFTKNRRIPTNVTVEYSMLNINFALGKINQLKSEIKNDFNKNKKEVTNEFSTTIDEYLKNEGGFDASIGSLFKILCSHVDLFVKVLKNVEKKIKVDIDGGYRNLPIINKDNITEYNHINGSNEISIRAFPDYVTKEDETNDIDDDDRAIVDKWMGSNSKFDNYQEVIFINDLYASIKKSAKKDRENVENLFEKRKGWYPVNPLETLAFDNNNKNPWEIVNNSNVEPVIKLMLQRMTLFLNYSYSDLELDEVNNMAKIEANQAYEVLINKQTKDGIMSEGASDTEWAAKFTKFIGNSTTNFGDIGDYHGLRMYFNNDFFGDGDGTKTYHHDSPAPEGGFNDFEDAFIDKYEYIPITQSNNEIDNNKGLININDKSNLLNSLDTRSNTNSIFVSNVISNETTNGVQDLEDENEKFIKIIDEGVYKSNNLKFNSYTPDKTTNVTESSDGLIRVNNDLLGGLHKTHEFTRYKSVSGLEIPLSYEFYGEKLKIDLINRNIRTGGNQKNVKDFTFQPSFKSNTKEFQLFGTKFYYSQSNIAKALLFLHTIPFAGTSEDILTKNIIGNKNLKFFNQRAGFISTPKSWILFLGGLLYRESFDNGEIKYNEGVEILVPNLDEIPNISKDKLLIGSSSVGAFGAVKIVKSTNFEFTKNNNYVSVFEKVIDKLPNSVKKIFIDEFINWVNSDWNEIKGTLEIFNPNTTPDAIQIFWDNFGTTNQNDSLLSGNNNYEIFEKNKNDGVFDLTIKDDSDAANALHSFFNEKKIIINGTYRIWSGSDKRITNFVMKTEHVDEYLKTFLNTFKDLNNKPKTDPDTELNNFLFDTDNVDDIKLGLYKNVKSIYNKWILGVGPDLDSALTTNLYDSFNFLDRAHIDIRDKFKVSPTGFVQQLSTNANKSFYHFIADILSANNFDFIALPTFVDYSNKDDVKSIFEPSRFSEKVKTKGPQFICMYFGEKSSQLNIDKKSKKKKDDSFSIPTKYDKDGKLNIGALTDLPTDFKSGNRSIPYFLVNYADQNQSLFKKINLNQSEFTETNESLEIIDSLSKLNRNNSIGQNLFDVYNNRAYSAEVEMLGCAQIQPFMFFQINNVPIFDGAYTIINTRHHIKPNHMTTTFKGVRIRSIKTKMVGNETIYAHLLANLNEVDNEDANLTNLENYVSASDKILVANASEGIKDEIKGTYANPLKNMVVTSDFGPRSGGSFHKGMDFRAEIGTDVLTINDLIIRRIRWQPEIKSGGLYVDFKVKDQEIYVRYMHLSELTHSFFDNIEITIGMDINQGGPIGKVIEKNTIFAKSGKSGTNDAHLHMDIRNVISIDGYTPFKQMQHFFDKKDWTFNKNQERLDEDYIG